MSIVVFSGERANGDTKRKYIAQSMMLMIKSIVVPGKKLFGKTTTDFQL
jgi:hypothetical protein